MNESENMAVQNENSEAEDSLLEEIVEEPQDESISLEEALSDDGKGQPDSEQPQSAGGQKQEPGYVRQRIDKAVQKAIAETEARLTA